MKEKKIDKELNSFVDFIKDFQRINKEDLILKIKRIVKK
jgi:hypothetical protein